MKAIKIIGLSLMTFVISGTVSAQREIGTTSTAASTQEYFKDVKTLKTFFISGEVPATFPKYDNTLDKVGNKELVKKWINIPANKDLLTQEAKDKFDRKNADSSPARPVKK
jgi:hypothetical protein